MKISFRHQVHPVAFVSDNFAVAPQKSDSNTLLYLSTITLLIWHSLWVQPKSTWSRDDVSSTKSTSPTSIFHVGLMLCFFPASFLSFTYTNKNRSFSRLTNKHSQFGTFSQPLSNTAFSNCFSHGSPAKRWPSRFRSRGTTGSSILDHDFGHLSFGRRIQISGHSDFGISNNVGASSILTWVLADTASAACPAHPGSLDTLYMTFAAVICDADDPCSMNTAYEPESFFTMSPRSTTLPLYFWYWGSTSDFWRWQRSISDGKWTYLLTSFLFLTLAAAMPVFSQVLPILFSTAAVASGIFNAWGIGKLMYQIVMAQWIHSFCRDVIFEILVRHTCQSYSHWFGIDNTSIFGPAFPNIAAGFPAAIHWCFTRHCCWHQNFPTFYERFSWCV